MKKAIAILLLLTMTFSLFLLTACTAGGGAGEENLTEVPPESSAPETKPTSAPFDDGKPYKTEKFTCHRGELTISGKIYIPKQLTGKLPTVIISHGYSNTMVSMQAYALDLAKNGYVSVCFDFCGGAANSESDGETTRMSIFTEEEDLKAVYEAVCALEYVDTDRLYLLGASQGGAVSAMAAADLQENIAGLILLYPAFSAADDARAKYASVDEVPETVKFMGMQIGKAYYEGLFDYDPYADATRYTGDVLIFHGTLDTTVAYEYSVNAASEYPNAELVTIEGAGHGFQSQTLDDVLGQIRAFLDEKSSR